MTLIKLNDEQLMSQIAQGDSEALATLYDRYATAVMGVVYRILHNRELAEEVVQETFWRVWDKANSFHTVRGTFKSWMYSIARRHAIDLLRRHNVRPQAAQNEGEEQQMMREPDPTDDMDEQTWQGIQQQQVKLALASLPPEQSEVIELAYFKGLTRKEIAQTTGNALGTIHTRARLALNKLRTLLQTEGVELV